MYFELHNVCLYWVSYSLVRKISYLFVLCPVVVYQLNKVPVASTRSTLQHKFR